MLVTSSVITLVQPVAGTRRTGCRFIVGRFGSAVAGPPFAFPEGSIRPRS